MLRRLGSKFPAHEHPELLVGLNKADDAAVYKLNDEQALVQTLDFFAPVVDDPYQYGAISAANALNDVYAMGGDVLFALNIAAFPEEMAIEIVAEILEGGADKVKEGGGGDCGRPHDYRRGAEIRPERDGHGASGSDYHQRGCAAG